MFHCFYCDYGRCTGECKIEKISPQKTIDPEMVVNPLTVVDKLQEGIKLAKQNLENVGLVEGQDGLIFRYEATDRAALISRQLEDALREQPYMMHDKTAMCLLDDACSSMYNLYNYLNGKYHELAENTTIVLNGVDEDE